MCSAYLVSMIYEGGVNWFFFPCVLQLPLLPPAPLQPGLEQKHELCTNEMDWQEIQVGSEQWMCTESHLHSLTGTAEPWGSGCASADVGSTHGDSLWVSWVFRGDCNAELI